MKSLSSALGRANSVVFNSYCILAAFGTYFCMYAIRKPFSVGTFSGVVDLPLIGEVDYKIALIITQIIGYLTSKFLGIKFVSEAQAQSRGRMLFILLFIAELALLGFALVPRPWNIVFLLLNGLPLGMVWGLVFAYLEGRKTSEILGAGLSTSYIVASGMVKSVGRWVMVQGVSEFWMPFVVGLIFFPFLLLFIFLLNQIPAPTAEEERLRTKRSPMHKKERHEFMRLFAPGLIVLTVFYMFLTAYRDFRDNFAREIWDALGHGKDSLVYTSSEVPIALIVLFSLAMVSLVKDNKKAVALIHVLLVGGSALIGLSTLAYQFQLISGQMWMVLAGLGLYLGYVPFGCVLFDRIIAETGFIGTAGFMIYVTDAFGYAGSVTLLLYKNFGQLQLSWLDFFIGISYVTSIGCSFAFAYSLFYFRKIKRIDQIA